MESFSAGAEPVLYRLNPDQNWEPDLDHLEHQLVKNPEVSGVLIINPNNPTGAVYSRNILEQIVQIAEKHRVILISDEIYFRMVYNDRKHVQITEIAQGRVPLIVMRGVSKDVPWPGSRSGWIEFHNVDLDPDYKAYCEGVKKRMLMEVCSTTLPQTVLPKIYQHPEFEQWNRDYNAGLQANGNRIAEILGATQGLRVSRPDGAFYMMPLFRAGLLTNQQTLPIKSPAAKKYIENETAKPGIQPDQRFAYYLLASTGICAVPASGFYSKDAGFRITTLERDPAKRDRTYEALAKAIEQYLNS
jgi:aspartate/methionine/tyrosine aminotransferase